MDEEASLADRASDFFWHWVWPALGPIIGGSFGIGLVFGLACLWSWLTH